MKLTFWRMHLCLTLFGHVNVSYSVDGGDATLILTPYEAQVLKTLGE